MFSIMLMHRFHLAMVVAAAAAPAPAEIAAENPARIVNTSWDTIPLFAHVRIANFTSKELRSMAATLRSLTMQGTLYGGLSAEEQAHQMRQVLSTTPIFIYRNL